MTPPNPKLQRAAQLIVLAFSLALENVACFGDELDQASFAAMLRSPAIGLTPEHHAAIDRASEAELVEAIRRVIASPRFDQRLVRQTNLS